MKIKMPIKPILLVDDEAVIVDVCQQALLGAGFNNVVSCLDSREARSAIQQQSFAVVVLDLIMPHVSGEALLDLLAERQPGVPVIVMTGRQGVGSAVECMRKGAYDYLVKPVSLDRFVATVKNALKIGDLQLEMERLSDSLCGVELQHPAAFAGIITRNAAMHAIFSYVEAVAGTQHAVLITGETGAGKERVALALHQASDRCGQFVAVNVAGLDDHMFSDTLFGHTKGAFTGADAMRPGLIESASGGTLFLDEIGDLSMPSQVKLLRLLQEHEYMPLGSDATVKTDVRVVVATNMDHVSAAGKQRLRPDLFYRLNTHKIRIPALRERLDDLPILVEHFIDKASALAKRNKPAVPPALLQLLATYSFPGNIRELEGMIVDAVSRHTGNVLSLRSFKEHIALHHAANPPQPQAMSAAAQPEKATGIYFETLPAFRDVKRLLAEEAIRRAGGNHTIAAEMLGVTRQGLMWHLKDKGSADAG